MEKFGKYKEYEEGILRLEENDTLLLPVELTKKYLEILEIMTMDENIGLLDYTDLTELLVGIIENFFGQDILIAEKLEILKMLISVNSTLGIGINDTLLTMLKELNLASELLQVGLSEILSKKFNLIQSSLQNPFQNSNVEIKIQI